MKPLIVANWKMNPQSLAEAKRFFDLLKYGTKSIRNVEVVICPPFVYLSNLKKESSNLKLGAQNCFWEKEGAFTGEVSATMLKNLGCKYVILGHSERRRYFKENNLMMNKKIKLVLQTELRPIFCIGETEQEKNRGEISKVIKAQIEKGLKKIPKMTIEDIVIAYEPVWAIGTGKDCKPVQVQVIQLLIRKIITGLYDRNTAQKTQILYGGSVNQSNALNYLKDTGIAGLLIGGVSLRPKEFIGIIKDVSRL